MSKKMFLVLVLFIFLISFNFASAQIIINEVKLYPPEERFIELFNNGIESVDLTGWYIQRKTQNGSSFGSLVSNTNFQNKKIEAGGYLLIARSGSADLIIDNLTLTESNAIQIKNSDGEIVDKICWGEVFECSDNKASNPSEGQSVQRNEKNILIVGAPTPGVKNYITASVASGYSGSSFPVVAEKKIVEVQKIKTQITANKTLAFVGVPVEFKLSSTGYINEPLVYGEYFINFGDGDSKQIKVSDSSKVVHIYYYEGDYDISLLYYKNYYSDPEATDKITIKIIPANVSISRIGDEKDFYVEISNNSDYEADLSNWFLTSDISSYAFPRNTVLGAQKKIILSPKITNFSVNDKNSLRLLNSEGNVIYTISDKKPVITKTSINQISRHIREIPKEISTEEKINTDLLPANAVSDAKIDDSSNLKYLIGLLILLSVSAGGAYYIRNKNRKAFKLEGSDFEIIDE